MNKLEIAFLAIIFLGFFGLAQNSEAKVINVVNTSGQPSCEAVDVQRVINDAGTSDGDTVFVPAGSCTWNARVDMNKAITLKGAGVDITIITDATASNYSALLVDGALNKIYRVTGFTFQGESKFKGAIRVQGTSQTWRIDHNKFNGPSSTGGASINTSGYTYGVIDHNTFLNPAGAGTGILAQSDGAIAWTRDLTLGTVNAVYIEDNIFDYASKGDSSI